MRLDLYLERRTHQPLTLGPDQCEGVRLADISQASVLGRQSLP